MEADNDKSYLIDWHLHSYYSDGIFSPIELLQIGLRADMSISLTDHDTVRGIKEAINYANQNKIKFIPGLELSTADGLRTVHLLCYFPLMDETKLDELEGKLKSTQEERTARTTERLRRAHNARLLLDIEIDELKAINPHSAYIGESHVCDDLWRKKIYRNYEEARDGIKRMRFWEEVPEYYTHSPKDGIQLVKKYGAKVSLAHLSRFQMNEDEERRHLRELKDIGLDAMEVVSSRHTDEQITRFLSYSREFNLKITVGSDYHSPGNTRYFRVGFDLEYTLTESMLQDVGISREEIDGLLLLK